MVRVGICGASGYAARELLRILARHPQVHIAALTTRQDEPVPVASLHPSLTGLVDCPCENLPPAELANRCDAVFCAVPHAAAMDIVPSLLAGGCRVVDLSADYRLNDPGLYEQWYGHIHTDPTRLGSTVYGLPELWADQIVGQDFVANPGCYTSTSILGLAPLLAAEAIEASRIVIDAKSGVSGAGRALKRSILFHECNESVTAYSVGNHRHTPEIEQVLSDVRGDRVSVLFTPHLMPMDRGILCTMYAVPVGEQTEESLLQIVRDYYQDCPFVRVVDHIPATKDSVGTNYCDISVRLCRETVMVFSCLDNLVKGAAGVAVQNFNLMHGFAETMGLLP